MKPISSPSPRVAQPLVACARLNRVRSLSHDVRFAHLLNRLVSRLTALNFLGVLARIAIFLLVLRCCRLHLK